MKLRISHNFLRFRLSKTDVDRFQTKGRLTETVGFGQPASPDFVFEIVKSDAERVAAAFTGESLTVFVPQTIAEDWFESDSVGFEGIQRIDDQSALKILIEKDFTFLKPKPEDDSDNFPHPLKSAPAELV